ncbi:MAG TPA: 5-oxoprolinase subunit PxpB [Pyrinomonadaceae bacterium]|jgi:inhibitor of KinA
MKRIFPLGESALTIEFSNEISPETNDKVINLAKYFDKNKFPGFIEIFPAFSSLTVFYEVYTVRQNFPEFPTAFDCVKNLAENALRNFTELTKEKSRVIKIPVCFDKRFALDLDFVAETNRLKKDEVIEIFTAQTFRVYMLGFLPGFAYLGEVDARIATPRKAAPRLKIPKGSVGIAGRQTGIYPLESPGGWQIIGATDVELFTPYSKNPTFLRAGDLIRFHSVN